MSNNIVPKLRRLVSYFIDWYIISMLLNLVIIIYMHYTEGIIHFSMTLDYFDIKVATKLLCIMGIIDFLYFVIIPAKITKGQTLGKKIMKLKVISNTGEKASVLNLLVRNFFGIIIIEGCFSPMSNYMRNVLMIKVGNQPIQYMVYIYTAIGILSILSMFISKEGKMIHDYIGKTKVVDIA